VQERSCGRAVPSSNNSLWHLGGVLQRRGHVRPPGSLTSALVQFANVEDGKTRAVDHVIGCVIYMKTVNPSSSGLAAIASAELSYI
jgi:hypothetical protein